MRVRCPVTAPRATHALSCHAAPPATPAGATPAGSLGVWTLAQGPRRRTASGAGSGGTASNGGTTPCRRTRITCSTTSTPTTSGSSTTCHSSIWPGVQHVEVRTDADCIQAVLGLRGDPLRVEVGLRQIAGERGPDRADKRHRAGDPGQRPLAPPGGHEELAPEMDHHAHEEQLHAPQVHRVEEMADRRGVPPRRALHASAPSQIRTQTTARPTSRRRTRRSRTAHTPVGGPAAIDRAARCGPTGRATRPSNCAAGAGSPLDIAAVTAVLLVRRRGNGNSRASTNTTTINRMIRKFVSEICTTPQCR